MTISSWITASVRPRLSAIKKSTTTSGDLTGILLKRRQRLLPRTSLLPRCGADPAGSTGNSVRRNAPHPDHTASGGPYASRSCSVRDPNRSQTRGNEPSG